MSVSRVLTHKDGMLLGYRLWRGADRPRRLLVLLHGMASNHTRWSEFVEHTRLKESWDILRPDLRGHGESPYRGRLDMRRWCEDLTDLLDATSYDQGVFVGHSLGANVAVEFAARHPARVAGLALIDPVLREALRGPVRAFALAAPLVRLVVWAIQLLNLLGLRRRQIPNRDLRRLDEVTRETLLEKGKQREMIARYTSPWADLKHFATANYLQEMIAITRRLPALDRIQVPVLVLLSSGITFSDPQKTKKTIARFPRAETLALPAYHWPLTEKPKEVRQAIEQWCARCFHANGA